MRTQFKVLPRKIDWGAQLMETGKKMTRRVALISTGILIFFSFATAGQGAQNQAPSPQKVRPKAVTMTGTISLDGKVLVTDQDALWNISNADVLKGHEGQHITVKCQLEHHDGELRVLFIQPERAKQAAYLGDAAFRR